MKKAIILLLSIFLVFAGCTGGSSSGSSSGGSSNVDLSSSFNGGNAGIVATFKENLPPQTIRDNGLQTFSIHVELENQGESDVEANKAHVRISGIDTSAFNLNDSSREVPQLRGVTKQGTNVIPGGRANIIFSNLKYTNSLVAGKVPITFYADICYPYNTSSVVLMCINGDTTSAYIDENSNICDLTNENVKYANSGAPVSIENVKQYPNGEHSIQLMFDIVHNPTSDFAKIYEPNSIDSECNIHGIPAKSTQTTVYKDVVFYEIESGIAGLDCEAGNPYGKATLSQGRTTVTCTQDTSNQEEYTKIIKVKLKYDYLDRISKEIEIEHIQK